MYDVIVVGGGISGAMAAVASARTGAKTLIVEQYGFLGGMLTASGVGPMMTFHAGDKQVVQGITGELINRMKEKGKSPGHIFDTTGTTYTVTPFDAEAMKHELEIMLLESGGEILYHTMLASVKTDNCRISAVNICNKAGISDLKAKIFVDATGDADLSAWAGVDFIKGRDLDGACQPMTMNVKMRNVNIDKVRDYIKQNPKDFAKKNGDIIDRSCRLSIGGYELTIKAAQENKELTFYREELLFFETNTPGEVIINTTRVEGCDSTDPWSLSSAEVEGRRQVREIEKFMKTRIIGFEDAIVEYSGPNIGVRSSRQIRGEHILTVEELLSCKKFDDVVAHGGYPVDIHPPKNDETYRKTFAKIRHIKSGETYSIPYRCLINNKIMNLITVGRCISATFEAQGGIRVTPIAGAIGHAGGVAAGLAAKQDVNPCEISIKELQTILREQGAYLEI